MLSRGRDELLLANGYDLKTLYIKEGRSYLEKFLAAITELATPEKILQTFPNDAPLLDMLLSHGIVVQTQDGQPDSDAGAPTDEELATQTSGTSLFLLLSQSCNLGCIYCLNGKDTYKTSKNLHMQQAVAFRSVEKRWDDLGSGGRMELVLFGGEPLLNWPLAKKTILHGESLKSKYPDKELCYYLTTNLTIMPPDLIDWAKRYHIGILVDIDGPELIHNQCRPYKNGRPSYMDIVANVRRLVEAGLAVGIRTTVTALNQDHLGEIAQLNKDLGAVGSAFVPVCPVNSDEESLPESMLPSLEKILAGLWEVYRLGIWNPADIYPFSVFATELSPSRRVVMGCGAPYGNALVVGVNGDAYPCIYLVGIKKFFLGNIHQENCPDTALLAWLQDSLHVDRLEDCRRCPWRYYCGGGCPIKRLTIDGNPRAGDAIKEYAHKINCDYIRAILEFCLWEKAEHTARSSSLELHQQQLAARSPSIC
jgi:uncharacterized protein